MKKLIILALMLVATTSFAGGTIEKDGKGNVFQGFAPNGILAQLLTVVSTTVDMTSYAAYVLYPPSAGCKVRQMATTAKGANIQTIQPATTWIVKTVNRSTPFVNMSGCTAAELHIQN